MIKGKKIITNRFYWDDMWDIVYSSYWRYNPFDNIWEDYKHILMYVLKDDNVSKIRIL
jgi:hypothetical protein